MPALAYGLNLTRKSASSGSQAAPAKRKTIFDDESNSDDEGNTNKPEAIEPIDGIVTLPSPALVSEAPSAPTSKAAFKNTSIDLPKGLPNPPSRAPVPKASPSQYADLSSLHSSKLHASAAQNIDPTIYDYDSVYESLHSTSSSSANATNTASGPKYMRNLLAAAEIRKRDQLRAKEKMLVREREAEGDAFAGKERFVTAAYTAQQEEVRRAEEEETKRETEERERARRQGGGMMGLYKTLLERGEQRHEAVVKQAAEIARRGGDGNMTEGEVKSVDTGTTTAVEEHETAEKKEADMAKKQGAVVNEEGQVVDKRELLKPGLNVAPKPVQTAQMEAQRRAAASRTAQGGIPARVGDKQAMRERQTRMLEAQLLEQSKRAADDEDGKMEALQRATKSRKTEGEVLGAKERYLQRKREAEEAKKMGQKSSGN